MCESKNDTNRKSKTTFFIYLTFKTTELLSTFFTISYSAVFCMYPMVINEGERKLSRMGFESIVVDRNCRCIFGELIFEVFTQLWIIYFVKTL